MREPVLSTYKILKEKAFNSDIDETWIDWAIEMMRAGYESDNLYELAGISKPYNQFELQELTNKVLNDLNLDYSNKQLVIKNYAYFIITNSINKPDKFIETLRKLKDICIDLNMDNEYFDFYLLYFAKDDLTESENQYYWSGANRNNIDKIIADKFAEWKLKFEQWK